MDCLAKIKECMSVKLDYCKTGNICRSKSLRISGVSDVCHLHTDIGTLLDLLEMCRIIIFSNSSPSVHFKQNLIHSDVKC